MVHVQNHFWRRDTVRKTSQAKGNINAAVAKLSKIMNLIITSSLCMTRKTGHALGKLYLKVKLLCNALKLLKEGLAYGHTIGKLLLGSIYTSTRIRIAVFVKENWKKGPYFCTIKSMIMG